MESKNYAEVLIGGHVYTLGGAEEEGYIQRVASYINEKMSQLKKQPGFTRQSADYQAVMVQLNLADDFFKAKEEADRLEQNARELEKETYSLKHELISTQMKLEQLQHEAADLKKQAESYKADAEQFRALQAAKNTAQGAGHGAHNNHR